MFFGFPHFPFFIHLQLNPYDNPIPDPHFVVHFPFPFLSRFLPKIKLWKAGRALVASWYDGRLVVFFSILLSSVIQFGLLCATVFTCWAILCRVQPDDIGAHINIGRTFNSLQLYVEAEQAYRTALALLPPVKPGS